MRAFVSQMEEGVSKASIPQWREVRSALSESLYQSFGSSNPAEEIWEEYLAKIEE